MAPQFKRRIVVFLPLIALAGAALGIVLVEAALRMWGVSYPVFAASDSSRGHALRPGARGWQTEEGRAYVRINSDGLRDREHTFTKPEHTFRIALLGDSYVEALQVPLEKTFWWLLQDKLRGCAGVHGAPVEVVNFGVGGYGTAQELLTLREHVWKYSPD